MAERSVWLASHYDTIEQQHRAANLGIWIFLMTEVMLFGGLFAGYTAYRVVYPAGWAEGSRHLDLLIGGVNTGVLIVSSLTMALAVHSVQVDDQKGLLRYLAFTACLGALFLALKGLEYYLHFQQGLMPGVVFDFSGPHASAVELFFLFYYLMTGLHAIHLTIAVLIVLVTLLLARRRIFSPTHRAPIEVVGLYWHFVDVIWIFLLPLLYFIGRAR